MENKYNQRQSCLLNSYYVQPQNFFHVPDPSSLVWTVSWKIITAGPRVDNGTSRPQRVVVAFSSLVKCFRYASDASPRNLKRSSWRRSA